MTIKFEKIKPGMILYDVQRNKRAKIGITGNRWDVEPVYVESICFETRTAVVRWGGKQLSKVTERTITRCRGSNVKQNHQW